ncbi:hypothetical protein ACXIU3_24070, partial [Vibrio parahaemolyticus]
GFMVTGLYLVLATVVMGVALMLWCFSDIIGSYMPDSSSLVRLVSWLTVIVGSIGSAGAVTIWLAGGMA